MKLLLSFLLGMLGLAGASIVSLAIASATVTPSPVARSLAAKAGAKLVEKGVERGVERVRERSSREVYAERLLVLTNNFRAQHGLRPLKFDPYLQKAAQERTNAGYSHHIQFQDPGAGARSRGFRGPAVGENIAAGYATPEQAVNGWIHSPGHRAAMLTGSYTVCGMAKADGANRWIQMFGHY